MKDICGLHYNQCLAFAVEYRQNWKDDEMSSFDSKSEALCNL